MSDSPLVPPPPPNRKPVPPPPPPGKSAGAPMPVMAPLSMPQAPGMGSISAPVAAPMMPRPLTPPLSMPNAGAAQAPALSAMEQRMQDMEKRFQEQETSKNVLETQLGALQKELRAEHEKLLVQSIKVKEDENLSVRVDQQLREIQERLRREKYEQEIQESRGKAENQLKEVERRLTQERETWMLALKNQMKERETLEHDAEHTFGRRLREFERRYEEEKNTWTQTMRQKDEEIHQVRRDFQLEMEQWRHTLQEKDAQLEEVKEMGVQQRRSLEIAAQADLRDLQNRLDNQIREAGTWKAQMALLQTQLHQAEIQRQEEKTRLEVQQQTAEKEFQSALRRQESLAESRLADVQRDYARREAERQQHSDGVAAQLRLEKEAVVHQVALREEDMLRAQREIAELRRLLDLEKTQRQAETDQIRRKALEDAEHRMPELYADKLNAERKKWGDSAQVEIAAIKAEAQRAAASEKALLAKLGIEQQRMAQENEAWLRRVKEAENKRETVLQSSHALEQALAQLRTTMQADKARAAQELLQARALREKEMEDALRQLAELRNAMAANQAQAARAIEQERAEKEESSRLLAQLGVTLQAEQARLNEQLDLMQLERQREAKEFQEHVARLQNDRAATEEKAQATLATMQGRQVELEGKIQNLDQQLLVRQAALGAKSKEAEDLKKEFTALKQRFESNAADLVNQRNVLQKLSQDQAEWSKKEQEWRHAQGQMNDALNVLRAQLVETQNERSARDVEWQTRENAWKGEKLQLESLRSEVEQRNKNLEKAIAEALDRAEAVEKNSKTTAVSPEALGALAGLRQSMTEMTQLLTWARAGQKMAPAAKAA